MNERRMDVGPGFVRARECPDCGHTRCGEDCNCNCDAARAEHEAASLRSSLTAAVERAEKAETIVAGRNIADAVHDDDDCRCLPCQFSNLLDERDAAERDKHPAVPTRLLGDACVRFTERGELWLMNKRETGWASFGLRFDSWDELFRRFNVRVTEHGSDECGAYWTVTSMGEKR